MGSSALPIGGAAVDRLLDHNKFCSCEQHKRDTDSEDDGCLSVLRHTTIVGPRYQAFRHRVFLHNARRRLDALAFRRVETVLPMQVRAQGAAAICATRPLLAMSPVL